MRLFTVLSSLFADYQRITPKKLKLIDAYMFYVFITGVIQFVYCILVGTFPFNSFLSGFVSTVGCFVLAASLRIQVNPENKPLFPHIAPERAFADFIFAHKRVMEDAGKKARDEYLKKYLNKDDKQSKKKHKKKKKKTGIGLKIHENDAFADVAACTEQTSSGDESSKDVEILEKVKELHSLPKFKPAAFEAVDLKSTETNASPERHDSSSDENVTPDEISLPTTSSKGWKNASIKNRESSIDQEIVGQNTVNSDISFPTHKIKDEPLDSDASPPRRPTNCARQNPDNDEVHLLSKRKKSANDSDLDSLPPRRRIKDEPLDSDSSPPKRLMNCARQNHKGDDSDASPPRRRKPTNNSDSDLSPPRRHDDYAETSNRGKEFGNYPYQKQRRSGSVDSCRHKSSRDSDASLYDKSIERRRKNYARGRDENSSRHHRRHESHQRRRDSPDDRRASYHNKRDRENGNDVKSMTGKNAGLKTLEAHREEMKRLQEDEAKSSQVLNNCYLKLLKSWDGYTNGKDMAATRRAKLTGKGHETKEDRERKEREAKKQKELEEKYKNWNRGLRQLEERTEKLNEMARVAQEDFARHVDDKAMNEHLKKQLHEKDPMYKYVKKKKENAEIKSGTAYPKYKGSWPPNRFNIAPGYRWDGVNRSNGFEDRIAEVANRKVAQHTEYYENIAKYEV
uniref:BUD13 homolog n=1 Tax=Elaeophora elaphi TaxID=1147741 RepID=A0A0R3RYH7_9BILA